MENETPNETPSKNTLSPMVITGIIVLLVIVLGASYFMTKKGRDASKGVTVVKVTPTQAMMHETPGTPSAMEASPMASTTEADTKIKSFQIDASNYKFVPNTLKVNLGDTVKITFRNTQGMHNFMLDEFDAKSKTIQANQIEELSFVASKKGTFEYYCSVANHRAMGMVGTLTVN